jgi:hypothetical protein
MGRKRTLASDYFARDPVHHFECGEGGPRPEPREKRQLIRTSSVKQESAVREFVRETESATTNPIARRPIEPN